MRHQLHHRQHQPSGWLRVQVFSNAIYWIFIWELSSASPTCYNRNRTAVGYRIRASLVQAPPPPAAPSGLFGNSTAAGPLFGAKPSPSPGLFGNRAPAPSFGPSTAFSGFGNPPANVAPTTTATSGFGARPLFGNPPAPGFETKSLLGNPQTARGFGTAVPSFPAPPVAPAELGNPPATPSKAPSATGNPPPSAPVKKKKVTFDVNSFIDREVTQWVNLPFKDPSQTQLLPQEPSRQAPPTQQHCPRRHCLSPTNMPPEQSARRTQRSARPLRPSRASRPASSQV